MRHFINLHGECVTSLYLFFYSFTNCRLQHDYYVLGMTRLLDLISTLLLTTRKTRGFLNINPYPLILFSNVSHGEILCACVPFYCSSPTWNKQTSTLRLGVIHFVIIWNPLAFPFSTPKAAVLKCWQIGLVCPPALGTSQFLMLWCMTTQLPGIDCSSHWDKAWAVSSWCLPLALGLK